MVTSRLERRKARTRQALVDAARAILSEGGSTTVSIQEITERADVGFGTFYNHFTDKTELFQVAVGEVLEQHGADLARKTSHVTDPAELFATRFRLTAQLASQSPAVASVFVHSGMDFLISDRGLAPMALADIEAGMRVGRFRQGNPHLALVVVGGSLLAYLQLRLTQPDLVTDAEADTLAAQVLLTLGMPPDEAERIASTPLPSPA